MGVFAAEIAVEGRVLFRISIVSLAMVRSECTPMASPGDNSK